ncbi:MAG: 16S rRNA (cytidine(1402)-2'-O)-methyltransferase [Victivallales bacterium]|nr:16S rRNA (cytidine(1402)-2'-O)-methyltransferase [Victivallales bacterium]
MTETEVAGKLYIVTTPIGNLEDITLRALNVLREVELIAAEDTRRTQILLRHYDIRTRTVSYHSFNEHRKTAELLAQVASGLRLAVVSDAGTPCIADPGFLMVREAVKMGIEPVVVPGVSSLTFAVAASGLPSDRFDFYGFLPVKSGRKHRVLEEIRDNGRTAVVFESPYRVGKTLQAIAESIGADTAVVLVREATKLHEQIIRGRAGELAAVGADKNWKGEFVMVIDPGAGKNCPNVDDDCL